MRPQVQHSGAVVVFTRRSIGGSPRRSVTIVAICALVVGVVVAQVQVASGLRRSVGSTLVEPSQRTLVVAIPVAIPGRTVAAAATRAAEGLGSITGVVAAGVAVRFVETVAAGATTVSGQVGWADPSYLRLVSPDADSTQAVVGGDAALLPKALREALGAPPGGQVVIGGASLADIGDAPSSLADPGLRDAALLPMGLLGPGARFDTGSLQAAILFDRAPDDEMVRLATAALYPDAPESVAVVSRGAAPSSAARVEALAGSAGRTAVAVVAVAAWLILGALHLTMLQRRRAEIAVRMALGATPRDVGLANLVEAAVLGALGGMAGVSLAGATLVMLAAAGRPDMPPVGPIGTVIAVAASLLANVVAAALPMVSALRRDPADVLRSLGDT